MCYGSAKPIFMSDAPGFLQRQRARAAKHLVSEHAGGVIRLATLEALTDGIPKEKRGTNWKLWKLWKLLMSAS